MHIVTNDFKEKYATLPEISRSINKIFDWLIQTINDIRVEEPSKIYYLSWGYAAAKNINIQDNLYEELKRTTLLLLENEKRYQITLYHHQGTAGLLFALYHITANRKDYKIVYEFIKKILKDTEKLQWHEYDGEIIAFSYILAKKVNLDEYVKMLKETIANKLEEWIKQLDYNNLKNMVYVLFCLAYILDDWLVDIIKKYSLYSKNSNFVSNIINNYDIESLALFLFVLGRVAYNKKLRKHLKSERLIKYIRNKLIFELGNLLSEKLRESEFLSDDILPPIDLLAKIQLARVETGLDKPFALSKYELKKIREIEKMEKKGYFKVKKRDLIVSSLLASIFSASIILLFLGSFFPNVLHSITDNIANSLNYQIFDGLDLRWILLGMLFYLLGGTIKSVYSYGYIKLSYILSYLFKCIAEFIRSINKQ